MTLFVTVIARMIIAQKYKLWDNCFHLCDHCSGCTSSHWAVIAMFFVFDILSSPHKVSVLFCSHCLSLTYWVVVDVPYEAAEHGLLAHQGGHVDGGGLGVDQELPGLAEGGLGAAWPQPLGDGARVPARAWNMSRVTWNTKVAKDFLSQLPSLLTTFLFSFAFLFSVTCLRCESEKKINMSS